jgi:NAD(P)-dependent dehydrogenase (short-subunit alcohol dehydrogenase family)
VVHSVMKAATRESALSRHIGEACAFLCSEEAGYITGPLMGVNGGMYV